VYLVPILSTVVPWDPQYGDAYILGLIRPRPWRVQHWNLLCRKAGILFRMHVRELCKMQYRHSRRSLSPWENPPRYVNQDTHYWGQGRPEGYGRSGRIVALFFDVLSTNESTYRQGIRRKDRFSCVIPSRIVSHRAVCDKSLAFWGRTAFRGEYWESETGEERKEGLELCFLPSNRSVFTQQIAQN
jgi:hypothetical protein